MYPKLKEGQFLSISLMQFNEVINQSKDWTGKTAYLAENELFMSKDLTENDLVVRQINSSKIMDRILQKALLPEQLQKGPDRESFVYERDFYG